MSDIRLLITLNPETGQCQVSGPIDNKLLAYGMLEMARDAIASFVPPQIQPVSAIPNAIKLNGRS